MWALIIYSNLSLNLGVWFSYWFVSVSWHRLLLKYTFIEFGSTTTSQVSVNRLRISFKIIWHTISRWLHLIKHMCMMVLRLASMFVTAIISQHSLNLLLVMNQTFVSNTFTWASMAAKNCLYPQEFWMHYVQTSELQ